MGGVQPHLLQLLQLPRHPLVRQRELINDLRARWREWRGGSDRRHARQLWRRQVAAAASAEPGARSVGCCRPSPAAAPVAARQREHRCQHAPSCCGTSCLAISRPRRSPSRGSAAPSCCATPGKSTAWGAATQGSTIWAGFRGKSAALRPPFQQRHRQQNNAPRVIERRASPAAMSCCPVKQSRSSKTMPASSSRGDGEPTRAAPTSVGNICKEVGRMRTALHARACAGAAGAAAADLCCPPSDPDLAPGPMRYQRTSHGKLATVQSRGESRAGGRPTARRARDQCRLSRSWATI